MKTLITLSFFCSILFAKDNIAVINLKPINFESQLVSIVTDKLSFEIQQLGMFTLVERQNIEQIFKEQSLQLSGATDSMVEIGKILDIKYVLTGSFGKLDETLYFFSLKLIDVETAEIATNYFTIESSFKNFVLSAPKTCLSRLLKLEKTPVSKTVNVKELDVFHTNITHLDFEKSKQNQVARIFMPCVFCSGTGTVWKKMGSTNNPYRCNACMGFKYSGPETGYKLIAGKFQ